MRRRGFLAWLLAATLLLPGVAAAQEDVPDGADVTTSSQGGTSAVAVNTRDGSQVFRLAFQIRRFTGDVLDIGNAAVAVSSCENCRTIAVSIQVVLVFSDPSTVTPTNLALALNLDCYACETMASAYQLLLGTGGPVKLSPEANLELAQIRKEILSLLQSDLSLDEIAIQLESLVDRIEETVRTGIVSVETPEGEDVVEPGTTPTSPLPETTPTVEETVEPTSDPSPTPTPVEETPTEEPTQSPASPTPTAEITADV